MKTYLWLALGLLTNLYAQTSTQSKDWIDLSNKSDAEIIKILEREVALLAESPAEEASERVRLLQEQEKNAKQDFNQKTLLLEGELSLAASAKETAEKTFADLQTDSTALSAQIDLYARSQQRLRERIDKFPFKAVVLAKAVYTGDLGIIKEKMIYEAGRLAIAQVNGVKIISETLVKNNILVSDIIEATIEGKADCQPREWKALENGTRRVIYLYGIYDIYPFAEGIKLSSQAAQLQLPVETHFISDGNDASLAALPANIQQEIRAMLSTTEQANAEVRNNLNTLVQQEMQLLQNSGVTERKEALKSKFDALTSQMNNKRLDLVVKRKTYEAARQKFWDHLNGEQRIEIVTQSDLERHRSQDVIKAKLMSECLTQFRTTVKSLYSQEKDKVVNFQLAESSAKNMFRQVQLKGVKVLGIYLSPSEGDIKYTASVAFRFGFEYTSSVSAPASNASIEWVFIRGGSFEMGDTFGDGVANEKPVHTVTLDDYYLSKYEVTIEQFRQFCHSTGRKVPEQPEVRKDNHPVAKVSWEDARAFCEWTGGRLPTEAEWEYAAREGGKKVKFGTGKNILTPRDANHNPANYADARYHNTAPVGSFPPNALGLYDMAGNVREWCQDWYDENYYNKSPQMNPRGPSSGQYRLVRGGSYGDDPPDLRCTYRLTIDPTKPGFTIGFRCARDAR